MITISLCMIVKNEEDVLARCLESVKGIADEIIIIDTGSTDETKNIALKFTEYVFDFKWDDDFSHARNYSFSKANMDYILWLDADDVILEDDRDKFLHFKDTCDNSQNVVMMKYNVGFDTQGNTTFSYYRERLVKRCKDLEWTEPVHEVIIPTGQIYYSDVCITHKKEHEVQVGRNLEIYENILSQKKELSIRGLYYYGRELYYNSQYAKAAQALEKFINTKQGWVEDCINACKITSECYMHTNNNEHRIEALLRSLKYDAPRADICCEIGKYFMEQGSYQTAVFWYETAASCKIPKDGFINYDDYGYIPNIQLCVCYDKLGDKGKAIEYNEKAAVFKPEDASILYNRKYFD